MLTLKDMNVSATLLVELAGWIPAIVFPTATSFQLVKMIREKDARSISKSTWFLFGIANIGLYFYTEKYDALQPLVGFLTTALLDFVIVALAFGMRRGPSPRTGKRGQDDRSVV